MLKNSIKVTKFREKDKNQSVSKRRNVTEAWRIHSQGWTIHVHLAFSLGTDPNLASPRNRGTRATIVETLSRLVTATRCISAQCIPRAINTIYNAGPIEGARSCTCKGATWMRQRRETRERICERAWKRGSPGLCCRRRKFRVGQPDDGLLGWHGWRGRRSHPRQLEPRKRDVASAQREPAGAVLAGRDEAPSASARAAPHPSSSAHARASSTATATAAASRRLHAAVLLVSGGPQSRATHVSRCFFKSRTDRYRWRFDASLLLKADEIVARNYYISKSSSFLWR